MTTQVIINLNLLTVCLSSYLRTLSVPVLLCRMAVIAWVTQSLFLSVAIFLLLEEESVLHARRDLLCLKATEGAAQENKQPHSIESSGSNLRRSCKINKTTKWPVLFGGLSAAHMSLTLVVYGLKTHNKSVCSVLLVVYTSCWALTSILLLVKLGYYLSPGHLFLETTGRSGFLFTLFTLARNKFGTIFTSALQTIFQVASTDEKKKVFEEYLCSPELEYAALEQTSVNLSRIIVVSSTAYLISSSFTLFLILAQDENFEPVLNQVMRSTGPPILCDGPVEPIRDNVDMTGKDDEQLLNGRKYKSALRKNSCRYLNKNELVVSFLEDESDEDSFVFGWRL